MTRELNQDRYREMLENERQRMQHQMRVHDTPEDQAESTSELSHYDDHPADVATDTFERGKDGALRENARSTIDRIETALDKMERGTYGLCDICGQEIPEGRLNAVPYATLCIKCQADVEAR